MYPLMISVRLPSLRKQVEVAVLNEKWEQRRTSWHHSWQIWGEGRVLWAMLCPRLNTVSPRKHELCVYLPMVVSTDSIMVKSKK
jgi:hypothetical protein